MSRFASVTTYSILLFCLLGELACKAPAPPNRKAFQQNESTHIKGYFGGYDKKTPFHFASIASTKNVYLEELYQSKLAKKASKSSTFKSTKRWRYKKHEPLYIYGNAPYQNWSKKGSLAHVAAFLPSLRPAAGALVFIGKRQVGVLNAKGSLSFWLKGSDYRSRKSLLRIYFYRNQTIYSGQARFYLYKRTKSFESTQIYLYTDRGVYRPGEKIRIRALVWRLRGGYQARARAQLEVQLMNSRKRVLSGLKLRTNGYGIASGTLKFAKHAKEGEYQLVVKHKRRREVARLRVERFRAPLLHIRHNLGRFLTKRQKSLNFKVWVSHFSGKQAKGGILRARFLSRKRALWRQKQRLDGRKGAYTFQLSNKDLQKIKRKMSLQDAFYIELQVRGKGKRKDTIKRLFRYVANPYRAVFETDKDYYGTNEKILLQVKLLDLQGFPVAQRELKAHKVNHLKSKKVSYTYAKTDKRGIATFHFTMKKGAFNVNILDKDDIPLGTKMLPWRRKKPMTPELSKSVFLEGNQVPITLSFAPKYKPLESFVHGDITDSSGAIVGNFHVPIQKTGNQWVARGSFRAPTWGTMLLTLYCLGTTRQGKSVGMLTAGQQLSVHASRKLQITLSGWQSKGRPGQKLSVKATVRRKGVLQDASIGVALVERGTLSKRDPMEKTPHMRFYQPQLKTLSTSGAKMLTWPVLVRNWGAGSYDIALPPFRFLPGTTHTKNIPTRAVLIPQLKAIYIGKGKPLQFIPSRKVKYYGTKKAKKKFTLNAKYKSKPPSKFEKKKKQAFGLKDKSSKLMNTGQAGLLKMLGQSVNAKGLGGASALFGKLSGSGRRDSRTRLVRAKAPKQPKVRILIRKRFPPTSFWAPHLLARKKGVRFQVTLPETLASHQLVLVASDKRGHVGVLRKNIQVAQSLQVRSDFPRTFKQHHIVTTRAKVHNTSSKTQALKMSLSSNAFEILSIRPRRFVLAPGKSKMVHFRFRAVHPGQGHYTLKARGSSLSDGVKRAFFVHPTGIPKRMLSQKILSGQKMLTFQISRKKGVYQTASLSIAFPTIISSLQGLESLYKMPLGGIDSCAGRLQTVILVYHYLIRHGLLKGRSNAYTSKISTYLRCLLHRQNKSGSWGWPWWHGLASNPTATAHALEALATARNHDVLVRPSVLQKAASALWKTQSPDGLWPTGHIAFWEGPSHRIRWALSAKIFYSLAAIGKRNRVNPKRFTLLFKKMRSYQGKDSLTLGYILRGILAAQAPHQRSTALKKWLKAKVSRLLELRRAGHWEPQWFDAWGGQLQATLVILQVLRRYDTGLYTRILRENVQYLLSTRATWGEWHNGPGTAAALQALTLLPPPQKEKASQVEIFVNQKRIRKVAIDPKDPYLSAIQLRHIEFSDSLKNGRNQVSIKYNGRLQVPVQLIQTQWVKSFSPKQDTKLERQYHPQKRSNGKQWLVTLSLRFPKNNKSKRIQIVEPLPASGTLSAQALQALAKKYQLVHATVEKGHLYIDILTRKQKLQLTYLISFTSPTTAKHIVQPNGWAWLHQQKGSKRIQMLRASNK